MAAERGFITFDINIKDKRVAQRISVPLRVRYQDLDKKQVSGETYTLDISGGGLRLNLDRPFKKGDMVKTLIYFPYQQTPVTTLNKVIWCRRHPGTSITETFDIGLKYVNIKSKDRERFLYLFCDMMLNYFVK